MAPFGRFQIPPVLGVHELRDSVRAEREKLILRVCQRLRLLLRHMRHRLAAAPLELMPLPLSLAKMLHHGRDRVRTACLIRAELARRYALCRDNRVDYPR